MSTEALRLAGFVLPLSLDTFAVSAAIGVTGLSVRQRLRLSLLFVAFEGGMPVIGIALGAPLSALAGQVADYIAVAVLVVLGGWMLWPKPEEQEEERARSLTNAGGLALIGLGLSISLDELAIGFSLGLVRLPTVIAVPVIALQALVASQLGFVLGSRVGERLRERAEKLAGLALIALGVLLLVQRLTGAG